MCTSSFPHQYFCEAAIDQVAIIHRLSWKKSLLPLDILAKIFSNTVHKTSKGVPAQGCSSPQRVLQQQAGFGSLQRTAKQSQ